MKNNPNQVSAKQTKKRNKKAQKQVLMTEEFGAETDVNQVRQQNQQAEANKTNASGRFQNGSR